MPYHFGKNKKNGQIDYKPSIYKQLIPFWIHCPFFINYHADPTEYEIRYLSRIYHHYGIVTSKKVIATIFEQVIKGIILLELVKLLPRKCQLLRKHI